MGKYIIDLESGTHIFMLGPEGIVHIGKPDVVYETVDGMQIGDAVINAKPYTEPDLEQVRKEAFEKGYGVALDDLWKAMQKAIKMYCEIDNEVFLRVFHDVKCDWGESVLQALFKNTPQHLIDSIRQYEQKQEMDGLRQNIQTIVDQCGYTLDEIAEVLEKMREGREQ